MDPNQTTMNSLCIATISLARNEEEEKVLRTSLSQLANLGLPVFIVDGGSSQDFLQFLHGFSNFVVLQAKGLWSQAKKSITSGAKESKFILYTEPDKLQFFSDYLLKMIQQPVDENTGVILASRSSKGFSTFPVFQQLTENTINQCCKEVIGIDVDYCYGPFLFNSHLIPFLNLLDDNCGWGWRPYLFAVAHRSGFKVKSYEEDFTCPLDQREDNEAERIYRMKQLVQNINGLVQASSFNFTK